MTKLAPLHSNVILSITYRFSSWNVGWLKSLLYRTFSNWPQRKDVAMNAATWTQVIRRNENCADLSFAWVNISYDVERRWLPFIRLSQWGVCSLVGNDTQCRDCVLYYICKTITEYEDIIVHGSDTDTAVMERRLVLMARRHVSCRDVSTGAFYRPIYQRDGAGYWGVGVPHASEFSPKVSIFSRGAKAFFQRVGTFPNVSLFSPNVKFDYSLLTWRYFVAKRQHVLPKRQ